MRHSREEVIERAAKEYRRLDRLVAGLQPAHWRRRVPRPETRDAWTVKDALAHITYWKEHTARVIRGERRLPEMRGLDVNQINAIIYQRWKDRPPRQVLGWHRRAHQVVMDTLRNKSADWFSSRERGPYWPGDLDGHSAAHRLKDIEAALKRK